MDPERTWCIDGVDYTRATLEQLQLVLHAKMDLNGRTCPSCGGSLWNGTTLWGYAQHDERRSNCCKELIEVVAW